LNPRGLQAIHQHIAGMYPATEFDDEMGRALIGFEDIRVELMNQLKFLVYFFSILGFFLVYAVIASYPNPFDMGITVFFAALLWYGVYRMLAEMNDLLADGETLGHVLVKLSAKKMEGVMENE